MGSTVKRAHIVYFSGTGGTAFAAQALKRAFAEKDIDVKISEIFKNNIPVVKTGVTLILMYPVYAGDAPTPIRKWISGIEKVNGSTASVISVSGGGEISPNTACRAGTIRKLEKKGYKVNSEYMLCMPSNFIAPTPKREAEALIRILPDKCGQIAEEIITNTKNRKSPLMIDRIILPFFAMEKFGAKVFGKTLKADDSCNGCEFCAQKCPQGNIVMEEERPKFDWKCVLCMRCIYSCPQNAIKAKLPILKNAVLKDGYSLYSIEKNAMKEIKDSEEDKAEGMLWKGISEYLNKVSKV